MQMDLFVLDDLKVLLEKEDAWCVSLYMPAHRVTAGVQEDQIRFKNLLKTAEEKLAELSSADDVPSLKQAHKLLDDRPFWHNQSDGLAVFVSPKLFRSYRLPLDFKELVVVTDRFHIKPLIPLLSGGGHFYILALSQNDVTLFQCTRYRINEVELPGMPQSLDEALKYDEPEKQLQFHTGPPAGGTGKRAALFHGHGVGSDDAKDRILRFCQQVDRGLKQILADDSAPMVLAAVEYLLPIFQKATTYAHVLDQTIAGNPEGMHPKDLQEKGWEIVAPLFEQDLHDSMTAYEELAGTGRSVSTITEVVKAAFQGRVETAFVPLGIQSWGRYDPEKNEVIKAREWQPGTLDLLDYAAAQTLLHGGKVFALAPDQIPGQAPIAAILRY